MSSICPNCGSSLGCGCQKRISINGKQCCKKCVFAENEKARKAQQQPTVKHDILPNK